MQKYEQIEKLSDEQFRRLTGVKRKTFEVMVESLREADAIERRKGGPKPRLSVEDRLVLTLEYLREYRTLFHIGMHYGLSESQTQRTVRWVEDVLIKDKQFHLPGRKKLLESDQQIEVVLVDCTESPIERPKKKTKRKREKTEK